MSDSNERNPYQSSATKFETGVFLQTAGARSTYPAIVAAIVIGVVHWPITSSFFASDWICSTIYFFLGGVITAVLNVRVGRFAVALLYFGAYVLWFPYFVTLDPLAYLAMVVGLVLVLPALLGYMLVWLYGIRSRIT
jgi:hypothetical protein